MLLCGRKSLDAVLSLGTQQDVTHSSALGLCLLFTSDLCIYFPHNVNNSYQPDWDLFLVIFFKPR